MSIDIHTFGQTKNGKEIKSFLLTNKNGLKVNIINFGGILTKLEVPDRNGKIEDIVLGYDNPEDYLENKSYLGALIGRYCNRIGNSEFTIDSKKYFLNNNEGKNQLHGGENGFNKVLWSAEPLERQEDIGVVLTYLSKDGEEGYPGNLDCKVTYWLTDNNEFKIIYEATTEKPTHVNMTHHSYFNLTAMKKNILNHEVMINADKFIPIDDESLPAGEILSVKGTDMSFLELTPIGLRINNDFHQLKLGKGYDHNYVINKNSTPLTFAAKVYEPESGRTIEVYTTKPGIQFYTGNNLNDSIIGKNNVKYEKHFGLCLETQYFPNAPNIPNFPSSLLRPGETYNHTTVYRFSTENFSKNN